jgi:acetyl-CoA acetyltransferase
MTEAYIIDAVRTPRGIGKPGKGALSHLHPQHLAAAVLKALKDRNGFDTASGQPARKRANKAAILAGWLHSMRAMTLKHRG